MVLIEFIIITILNLFFKKVKWLLLILFCVVCPMMSFFIIFSVKHKTHTRVKNEEKKNLSLKRWETNTNLWKLVLHTLFVVIIIARRHMISRFHIWRKKKIIINDERRNQKKMRKNRVLFEMFWDDFVVLNVFILSLWEDLTSKIQYFIMNYATLSWGETNA